MVLILCAAAFMSGWIEIWPYAADHLFPPTALLVVCAISIAVALLLLFIVTRTVGVTVFGYVDSTTYWAGMEEDN